MSTTTNPIAAMFDMQRNAVLQSQKTIHRTLDAQTQATELLLETMSTSAEAAEQSTDLTKTAVDAYFDALETGAPGDSDGLTDLRATVHEQIDAGNEIGAETWSTLEASTRTNVEAMAELTNTVTDVVDDSFDAFLEHHEQLAEQADTVEIPVDE